MRGQRFPSPEYDVKRSKTMFWRCLNRSGKTNPNYGCTSKHSGYDYAKKNVKISCENVEFHLAIPEICQARNLCIIFAILKYVLTNLYII